MNKFLFSHKICCILLAAIIGISTAAFAKSGDIAGEYYSTDIITSLNGYEIDAINIGGQTLISAEDMQYYSFEVIWNAAERLLSVEKTLHAANGIPPAVEHSALPSGTPIGNYFETDIVTTLDSLPITAYNIGGRTYIHAEQMRDFGYFVDWNAEKRQLNITGPDRAGYEYSISLSNGEKPAIESEGEGAFSIVYTRDGITGRGDAKLFGSSLVCNGNFYEIPMGFYQNEGLFCSGNLQALLRLLAYDGNIESPCDPTEKYSLVNEHVTVKINGRQANQVAVRQSQGNGHVDYTLEVYDLPIYRKDEIDTLEITVGNTSALADFPITKPQDSQNAINTMISLMKKFPEDSMVTYAMSGDYMLVYMQEIPSFGVVKDRLYIGNLTTHAVSDDILEQVRQIEGFEKDILHPFAIHSGAIKNNMFFSCAPGDRTGDFYVELDSATVHLIAKSK